MYVEKREDGKREKKYAEKKRWEKRDRDRNVCGEKRWMEREKVCREKKRWKEREGGIM